MRREFSRRCRPRAADARALVVRSGAPAGQARRAPGRCRRASSTPARRRPRPRCARDSRRPASRADWARSSATSATSTRGTASASSRSSASSWPTRGAVASASLPPGMEVEVAEARWLPLDRRGDAARLPGRARHGREGGRDALDRPSIVAAAADADVRTELLQPRRRRAAPHRPQDRDDPPGRQVGEVPQGDDRDGSLRRAVRPARAHLRRGRSTRSR